MIHLRISQTNYQKNGLYHALSKELDKIALDLGILLEETDLKDKFRELIERAAVNENVVILIDEYDKPIIDYLDDLPKAEENRAIFKSFYSVLKDAGEYTRLLLITGVTRFSKVSIFSDLNNLEDISIGKRFNSLVGITQEEMEINFAQEIARLKQENPAILDEIKHWYNGYSWHGNETLYNPFSLLSYMKQEEFRNFWFATGSPTCLIKQIKEKKEFDFDNMHVGEISLGNFDIANTVSAPLLFQTGYLTIKSYDAESQTYALDYPNKEVKSSLLDALLSAYREVFPADSMAVTGNLRKALASGDVPQVILELNAIIGSIPYEHWRADTESIFHIITFLTFKKIGVDVYAEVHGSKGRCDVVVKTNGYIYVIELKLDGTAQEALAQILDTGYLQPYQADMRRKIALGISFSSEKREVSEYESKEL